MIITDDFVFIHNPKTGGSFVTDALIHLHEGKWNLLTHLRLMAFKSVKYRNRFGDLVITANKHGGRRYIPEAHRAKPVLSPVRNPVDFYVSQYEFGWWKRPEWASYYKQLPGFDARFGAFPDLDFPLFMELMAMAFNPEGHRDFADADAIGWCTAEFLKQNLSDFDLSHAVPAPDHIRAMTSNVSFILTHRLNADLHAFLLDRGYPADSVEFIRAKERMLPLGRGRSKSQSWERYYSPELRDLVIRKDRIMYELFPDFERALA